MLNRAKKNSPGSVDLYAKCIKEGPVEWTKPERALEAAKNVLREFDFVAVLEHNFEQTIIDFFE